MCKKISIYIKSGQYILQLNSDLHPVFTSLSLNPRSRFGDFNAWSGNIELENPWTRVDRYRFHLSTHPYIYFRIPQGGGDIDLFYSFISPVIQLILQNLGLHWLEVEYSGFKLVTGISQPADFYKTRNIFTRKVQSRNILGKKQDIFVNIKSVLQFLGGMKTNLELLIANFVYISPQNYSLHFLWKQRFGDIFVFNDVFVLFSLS